MTPAPCAACPACPVGPSCPAIARGVGRYCELVDPDHRDFHPEYVAILRGEAAAAPPPDPFHLALDLCPHRKSCQCQPPVACDLSGAVVLVTLATCRQCLSAPEIS